MAGTGVGDGAWSRFHPLIAEWFQKRVGRPTEVQEAAWPRIAAGEHVLITAPTGSGKTLTAFLWALHQFVSGVWSPGRTRVLYVSPLRALNNDIQRNLLGPLAELRAVFAQAGRAFPDLRVETRSGDTPPADRRRLVRHPPAILITTPESLNLMLSSPAGRSVLADLETVILDEVHAVVAGKRGVHLITAVDRLVLLSGEFQRIALSATIRPLEPVAAFVGGYQLAGPPHSPSYEPRPVTVLEGAAGKTYDLAVRFPEEAAEARSEEAFWRPLVAALKEIIGRNRSTLLFVNSRRMCEKLTLKINHEEERPLAYAHHGSLSRELREDVEQKLKNGWLRAIVATNSLELGIDIGTLDEVVLVQSPPSLSAAVQRVGRAGHQVGQVSRGSFYPTDDHDFLEAAVLAAAIPAHDIEAVRPVKGPLDVLAQVIVSMVGAETWNVDRLFAVLRSSFPFHALGRAQFDLVLNMLAGRYADSRIRELRPRLAWDRIEGTVSARKGALLALYMSGGTIPDRGYFHLRHAATGALIGELDEEFVWEARIGQVFTLGTQHWRIERITHNDVLAGEAPPKVLAAPFWKGEEQRRDFYFSQRIAAFLEEADARLDDPQYARKLEQEHAMDAAAAERLIAFLKSQKEATGCGLPHGRHLVAEFVSSGPGGAPGHQVVLHTLWGGRVNHPFALALDAAWEDRHGQRLEVFAGNDCVVLVLPHEARGEELLSLVRPANVEALLRQRLEGSGFFGARFRECAQRALLLGRRRMKERMPLWMSRLRSQKLFDAVRGYEDFPILLEAWRTCLRDEFDLEGLKEALSGLEAGAVRWSETHTTAPSPMARGVTWRQISQYMYRDDEPASKERSRLRDDLLREAVFTPALRPTVDRAVAVLFEAKRQRLSPGYAPSTPLELVEWVKERVLIPEAEWQKLLAAMQRDHGLEASEVAGPLADKLIQVRPLLAEGPFVLAREEAPRILEAFYPEQTVPIARLDGRSWPSALEGAPRLDPEADRDETRVQLLSEWLGFYGPIQSRRVAAVLGLDKNRLGAALEDLIETQQIILGRLIADGPEDDLCDGENFEILLRLARARAVPSLEPLPAEKLPLFMAAHQGLALPVAGSEAIYRVLEQLVCLPLPAALWEAEVLPARIMGYDPAWLDQVMQEGELVWVGSDGRRVSFCFPTDLDLLAEEEGAGGEPPLVAGSEEPLPDGASPDEAAGPPALLPDTGGRYDFWTLRSRTGLEPAELSDRLWQAVWQGRVGNDTFLALRKGLFTHFKVPQAAADPSRRRGRGRPGGRAGFTRWKGSLPFAGNWYRLPRPEPAEDPLESEERRKDRVRLLLDRYGLLFRELLMREFPPFRWNRLFRTLRLMELSGEVLAGYFFHGLSGPQFISHEALRRLERALPEEAVWFMSAVDPASLCGLPIEPLKDRLPQRREGAHLVFHGSRLVLVSERFGRSLTAHVPPDDGHLQSYFVALRHLLSRRFRPLRRLVVETINGVEAARSPYAEALRTGFDLAMDYKRLVIHSRPGPAGPAVSASWLETVAAERDRS